MGISSQKITFDGSRGAELSARLDIPAGPVRAYAIFAHCFTCSKDFHATRRISGALAERGIAVLRFDFTGLGKSEGDFASTNFSSNREDLLIAADYLRQNYQAPSLIIGHSLGGAAVLSIASDIPELEGVVTIGAPADAEHVVHNFGAKLDEINSAGEAEVTLAGRKFSIRKQFLEDLAESRVEEKIGSLRVPLLVMHAPLDDTVGIENATRIFVAAKHPKSFISLDKADHFVSGVRDANFVAGMIAQWSDRYLDASQGSAAAQSAESEQEADVEGTLVRETLNGKYQNTMRNGKHLAFVDEPVSVGGLDTGPTPYGLLGGALGACTSITMRMYANFKKLDVGRISVRVVHNKKHAKDCETCTREQRDSNAKIDVFERIITVEGDVDSQLEEKLLEIADKCPVHKTLEKSSVVETRIE
jgi:putative redox protein